MKILIYVEGPSDQKVLEMLFGSLLEQKREEGKNIQFIPAQKGDRKSYLLQTVPQRAVNILRNEEKSIVGILPDLYPKNKPFPHETLLELKKETMENFKKALRRKGVEDQRIVERFKVFCFKYDLEVLLLAAEEKLKKYLGAKKWSRSWITPVEDQNHNTPPKRVIEKLFEENKKKYNSIIDGPLIMAQCSYHDMAQRCPQCFKPFVEFLEGL